MLALTLCGQTQTGWTPFDSLILDGHEKLDNGKEMPFRLQSAQGRVVFATKRGILNWANGLTRMESGTKAGFVTWMEGSNRALQLAVPSHPDIYTWLQQVRLSRDAFKSGIVPGWHSGTPSQIAGRDCWQISAAEGPAQSLWIDQALGLTLRQQDTEASGTVRYLRTVTGFQLNPPLANAVFERPAGTLLQGIPHPSILARPSLTSPMAAFGQDLLGIKKKSKLSADLWLKKIALPPGFEYSATQFEESNGKLVREVWPRNQIGGPEFEPGGMPPGYTASAELSQDGQTLQVRFKGEGGGGPIVIIKTPQGKEGYGFSIAQAHMENGEMVQDFKVEYVAFLAADGTLVFGNGNDADQARLRRETSKLDLSKASAAVQSDFIDPTSGHTISFIQARGRDWKTCALLPQLEAPQKLLRENIRFDTWTLKKEFPLQVVSWTANGTTYALASSRLSLEELAKIAAKAAPAN